MTDTPGRKRSSFETSTVIKEVASRTFIPEETVRLVLDTFHAVVKMAIQQKFKVVIRHFGTYEAKTTKKGGFAGIRVKYKMAEEFRVALREEFNLMEKYGVETKSEAALLAQVTGECPVCKTKLESTKPPKCSNCGTAPFEGKESK